MGHLEQVPSAEQDELDDKVFYLPHPGFEKVDSTTKKLRVVFDAPAVTTNGVSLNDTPMTGPRFHLIRLTADVEKKYWQNALAKPDQEYHRILQRDQKPHSIQTLRMTRVTYGVR